MHLGGVSTNRDFLVATLRTPEFLAGDTTTDFIERVKPSRKLELPADDLARTAQIAALWIQGENRANAGVLAWVQSGWRNARLPDQLVVFECAGEELRVAYRTRRDGSFRLGDGKIARVHGWGSGGIDVEIDGRRARARVTREHGRLVVHGPRGDVELAIQPRFVVPGSEDSHGGFVARMPGKIIELRVKVGDAVEAGQTLLVLEAMKMEHPMSATEDGVVTEVRVAQGDQTRSALQIARASSETVFRRRRRWWRAAPFTPSPATGSPSSPC
jgi:propionyl-CoA carboxylase alpha chain